MLKIKNFLRILLIHNFELFSFFVQKAQNVPKWKNNEIFLFFKATYDQIYRMAQLALKNNRKRFSLF